MKPAILLLVLTIFINGLLVRFEITGILRELTRLSVLLSLGYLIYMIIKRPRSKP